MDLKQLEVEETATLQLTTPDDRPLLDDAGQPMTVTLYGPGSKQYAKAQAVQSRHHLQRLKRTGKMDRTEEEAARENADFLTACTKAFSPNMEYDGLQGDALFRAVYGNPKLGFIAEQASKFLNDWGNFSKPSTTT